MKSIASTTWLLLLLAPLTLSAETLRLSEPVESTAEYEVFGAPLDDKSEGRGLAELLASDDGLDGEVVRVTTRVAKVCQKKGCFFVATEGAASARVTFADYGFFVPTDSAGKQVTLVGKRDRVELSPERAAHYAEDLGEEVAPNAEPPSAPVFEDSIVATSVLIPRS